MNEIMRDALSTLGAAGFRPTIEGKKHFKLKWEDAAGRPRMLVVSRSPSDFRALQKNRAILKRIMASEELR